METEEFESLVKEKKFNEIISILKNILISLQPTEDNSKVEALLKQILDKEQEPFPQSIQLIGEAILNKISEKDTREWLFTVERDNQGLIKTITAK